MKKTIYFVRHGEYITKLISDFGLTEYGVDQIIDTAEEIKKEMGRARKIRIYHSPKLRAKHSAEIMAIALKPKISSLEESIELDCDKKCVGKLVNKIIKDKSVPRAILISHQPDLEDYLGRTLEMGGYKKKELK